MKQRILAFCTDEIAIDYKAVSQAINSACKRDHTHYRISGLCQTHDTVFFSMEETDSGDGIRYVLAPFSGTSNANIKADIFTRWSSGFSTKGVIRLSGSYLGLFESDGFNHKEPELHKISTEQQPTMEYEK